MSVDLKQKTINSLLWASFGQYTDVWITFIVFIILARWLEPELFGLIGMITVFTSLGHIFSQFGFSSALIQKKKINQIDLSTVFYLNIIMGFLLTFVIFFSAPLIAHFYDEPRLISLTQFMSINFFLSSFSIIQTTILHKELEFKIQVKIRLLSSIISGIIAISMALKGYGVWSLATQAVVQRSLTSFFLWFMNKWRPSLVFRLASLKKLIGFSSKIIGSQLINAIFFRFDNLVIGKVFSARELGFYTRGRRLQEIPFQSLSIVLSRVLFPTISKIQDDKQRIKNLLKKANIIIAFFVFPAMAGLLVLAEPMIRILLTDKWLPSVIYLQLLCLTGFIYPLRRLNLNVLKGRGRADIFFNLEIVRQILLLLGIIIGVQWGIVGLILGKVFSEYVGLFLILYYSGREIDYSPIEQLGDILSYLLLSVPMGFIVYGVGFLFGTNYLMKFIGGIILGIVVYYSLCRIFKVKALEDVMDIIRYDILNVKFR